MDDIIILLCALPGLLIILGLIVLIILASKQVFERRNIPFAIIHIIGVPIAVVGLLLKLLKDNDFGYTLWFVGLGIYLITFLISVKGNVPRTSYSSPSWPKSKGISKSTDTFESYESTGPSDDEIAWGTYQAEQARENKEPSVIESWVKDIWDDITSN